MRIMFTGSGGAGYEAIWRLLKDRYDLYFADADVESICPDIPRERRVSIPMAKSEFFEESVKTVCADLGIDILVPGVDEELLILAKLKKTNSLPKIMLPDSTFIELMLDKLACAVALRKNNLNAPLTVPIAHAGEIGCPLIIKPRTGRGSRGVMKISHASQIPAYMTLYQAEPDAIIAQEWVPGQEYTVFVLADEGANLRAVVPVRVDEKRGVTIRAEVELNPIILEYAKSFQATFKPKGPYNIQCMMTEDGTVVPFEVNPRISTTFCLVVAAGIKVVDLFLGHTQINGLSPISEGVKLHRHWINHISL